MQCLAVFKIIHYPSVNPILAEYTPAHRVWLRPVKPMVIANINMLGVIKSDQESFSVSRKLEFSFSAQGVGLNRRAHRAEISIDKVCFVPTTTTHMFGFYVCDFKIAQTPINQKSEMTMK